MLNVNVKKIMDNMKYVDEYGELVNISFSDNEVNTVERIAGNFISDDDDLSDDDKEFLYLMRAIDCIEDICKSKINKGDGICRV